MEHICEFENRANLNHFTVNINEESKDVILYDDHRTLFPILFDLKKYNLINDIPNLIYFDYHDDCVVHRNISIDERHETFGNRDIEGIESREIWSYGEFDLSTLDNDWLTAAMDMNLVKDAFVIGVKENNNINYLNNRYTNAEVRHHLYELEHLDDATGNRGTLGDLVRNDADTLYIRSFFNFSNQGEMETRPFVLDFDLDCFSTTCCDRTIAWPCEIFIEKYVANTEAKNLMNNLIRHASLITICREPKCCGGLGESNKILSYLDYYFFEGQLKTAPLQFN